MTSVRPTNGSAAADPAVKARQMRALRWAFVRTVVGAVAVLALYYTLPLDERIDANGAVFLVLGLAVLGVLLTVQIWQVMKAEHPRLRAIETLATSVPLFIIVFATTYVVMDHNTSASFSEPLSRTDALYFTVTVFSTVGFGDIAPVTEAARIVVMVQMVVGLVLVGLVARILFSAVDVGLKRKGTTAPDRSDVSR